MDRGKHLIVALTAALTSGTVAMAAPMATGSFTSSTQTVSNNDLINGLAPTSSSGTFTLESSAGIAVLTNGTFGGAGPSKPDSATAGTGAGAFVDYALNATTDIGAIDVFAGWDVNRDAISVRVLVATIANPTFTLLYDATGNQQYNPTGNNFTDAKPNGATRLAITDPEDNVLAAGVTAIRFEFGEAGSFGWSGYRELDVFAVPEPASLALFAVGGLLAMKRRKA